MFLLLFLFFPGHLTHGLLNVSFNILNAFVFYKLLQKHTLMRDIIIIRRIGGLSEHTCFFLRKNYQVGAILSVKLDTAINSMVS